LTETLAHYPKHSIWHIANLMYSLNNHRKTVAKKLLRDVYKRLTNPNSSQYSKNDAQMLADSQALFQNFINLAGHQTKEKKIRWNIDKKVTLVNFLVPTKQVLLSCGQAQHTGDASTPAFSNYMQIAELQEQVDVASSKAKPKAIVLLTQCGKKVKFLCKQEKDGDLRKDAHMMEVNTLVNRLLTANIGARQRKLNITTYGVICLNEECGLLEWVNHTECLRQVVNASYNYDPVHYPNISFRDILQPYTDFQAKHEHNVPQLVQAYSQLVSSFHYRPSFHKWFLHKHSDPTAWLLARERYTHSVAAWSAVGYIIGLGDRHTENILINTATCEAVHVDFDCLFDKGLHLLRPEIVPFRLTSNMIDAMGITGVEGVYRSTLELSLSVLREHREALLSVLEPFLRDPTVSWSRLGRAQRTTESSAQNGSNAGGQGAGGVDSENKEANEMLVKISERLKGVYNIVHPHRDKLLRSSSASAGTETASADNPEASANLSKGLGAGKEEQSLPLSVQGQAQRLIDEATAVENLAQLYVGTSPSFYTDC
jgi:serine/threonine-protein kinase ATR